MIHIIPINDLEEHIQKEWCGCGPEILYRDPDSGEEFETPKVVHNAYDGRD